MIIFTKVQNTKEVLMAVRPDNYNFYEFNLSSPINHGYNLLNLIPNPEYIPQDVILGKLDTAEFDIQYGQFIMNNQEQFLTFMNIVLPLYNDPCACVIIYITDSKFRNVVTESLSKLIQQRYGYPSYIVNELEDIYYIKDDMSFSPRGILAIQDDSNKALLLGYYGAIPPAVEE